MTVRPTINWHQTDYVVILTRLRRHINHLLTNLLICVAYNRLCAFMALILLFLGRTYLRSQFIWCMDWWWVITLNTSVLAGRKKLYSACRINYANWSVLGSRTCCARRSSVRVLRRSWSDKTNDVCIGARDWIFYAHWWDHRVAPDCSRPAIPVAGL